MNTYQQHQTLLLDEHQTFSGETISFRLYEFEPDFKQVQLSGDVLENAKTLCAIEAFIQGQSAGYILLGYISETFEKHFLATIVDWYIHRYMDNATKKLWLNQDIKALKQVALKLDINHDGKEFESLKNLIIEHLNISRHHAAYKSFESYWVGKPNVEYSCVYDKTDVLKKDFSSYPFTHVQREKRSFRSNGVAQKLYEVAAQHLKKHHLYVYASTTQTADGQKMWRIMENHPRFTLLSETLYTTHTTQRNELIAQARLKMTSK